jgi:diguanylate cyclase (GGDEF)-like protein
MGLAKEDEIQAGSLKSLSDTDFAKLSTLSFVSRILHTSHRLDEVLDSILSAIITSLGAHRGFIRLFEPSLEVAQDHSNGQRRAQFQFSSTLVDSVLADQRPLVMLDAASQSSALSAIHTGTRSVMIQPILAGDRLIGLAYVDSLIRTGCFGGNELKLLGIIAEMLSGFLERTSNAAAVQQKSLLLQSTLEELQQANRRLSESAEETIYKLARAAEVRDDEGGEHVRRVSLYCEVLARQLGASPIEAARYRIASQLHDVGKVGLPDSILLKTGRYTDHERQVMQQHTVMGARILSGSSNPVIQLAEEMALHHHERWDGTGYPQGLAGEQIPFSGRIIAVADVFDALVTERRYKPAWTTDRAFKLIAENAGVHFDPRVSRAFLDIASQVLAIRSQHQGPAPSAPPEVTVSLPDSDEDLLGQLRLAVEQLSRGEVLSQGLRAGALVATQQLGALLGSRGHEIQSARRLEGHLRRDDLGQHHAPRLAELLAELERLLTSQKPGTDPTKGTVLVVDPDPYQREALVIEASQRGTEALEAESVEAARRAISVRAPQAVVVESNLTGADELLSWLAMSFPEICVVIMTAQGQLERRFELARLGCKVYLEKPISAGAVLDQIEQHLLPPSPAYPRILQVPRGAPLTQDLERHELVVKAVADQAELCAPGQCPPDLYLMEIVAVDTGILELCRVLRSDPRLACIPIVMTVWDCDEESARLALEAGVDDIVVQPVSPPYLATRMRSLLKRHQATRRSALRDAVTGLPELSVALRTTEKLLALAARNAASFTVCTLQVESFAELQDSLGPAQTSLVLSQLANVLERSARATDVVARFQEAGFLLALYGSNGEAVQRRCESVNSALIELLGSKAWARCSVRMATYPQDGTRISELLDKAGCLQH